MSGRALRVGVLLGGKLVEERLLVDPRAPVTVGQRLENTLSIPDDALPATHALFVRDRGRWVLRLAAGMTGRLAQAGHIDTELGRGNGEPGSDVALEVGARGRVRAGDATIVFQELAAPPVGPRVRLPAEVRGTLADRIDGRLAAIVGGSLVLHVALGAWAWVTEPETRGLFEPRREAFRHETYEISVPDEPELPPTAAPTDAAPEQPSDAAPGPSGATPPHAAGTAVPVVSRETGPRIPARPAQMSADDAQRFAQILSGHDEAPGGTGTMRARQPGGDLAQQIAEIRDHGATPVVGNESRARRPPERLGTAPTRIADDPGQVARQPERREEAREVRIALRPEVVPAGEQTTLTVEVVLARIRGSYLDGLQRCYKKGLASDGALSGKIALAFTVTETGRLADISARGLTPEVDACIRAQMNSWRFPIPRDGDRGATEAAFALALALQAS